MFFFGTLRGINFLDADLFWEIANFSIAVSRNNQYPAQVVMRFKVPDELETVASRCIVKSKPSGIRMV